MRKTTIVIVALLTACHISSAGSSPAAEAQKKEEQKDAQKGVTVDDLTRGVKSAAKNIENEIPKIGAAIGGTIKNITGKGSKKQTNDKPETSSK